MKFLEDIRLIQGGMAVYVSTWRLARAVAAEKPGVTAGTISGTALDVVHARLLQLGDPGGHITRALNAFDSRFDVDIGANIRERYFIPGGKEPTQRFKETPVHLVRSLDGGNTIPPWEGQPRTVPLILDRNIIEMLIVCGFIETWLAKEGHQGRIFMNFLKKVEVPLIYVMYGAILAGIDGVVVGAGNPDGLPAIAARLTNHETVSNELHVLYSEVGETFSIQFDPKRYADGKLAKKQLKRPALLAIVTNESQVEDLARSKKGPPDGFVIEHNTAGGHNALPIGAVEKDSEGQFLFTSRDEPNFEAIARVGLPFWPGGGYDSPEKLYEALAAGARGIQVGTMFSLAEESGMRPDLRAVLLEKLKQRQNDLVLSSAFSPAGFPFKIAKIEGSLAEEKVYEDRQRVCSIGGLLQRGLTKPAADGTRQLIHRCPAEPLASFTNKRGLPFHTQGSRCICNGLFSTVGLAQIHHEGRLEPEPPIITLGMHLDGLRRVSRNGQARYQARDVVAYFLDEHPKQSSYTQTRVAERVK